MDARLEQLQRTLDSAIDGMSAEQFNWHPADKWCAAEILEHLYLSYTGTIKGFEKALQAGKPLATRGADPSAHPGSGRLRIRLFTHRPRGAGSDSPHRTAPGNGAKRVTAKDRCDGRADYAM